MPEQALIDLTEKIKHIKDTIVTYKSYVRNYKNNIEYYERYLPGGSKRSGAYDIAFGGVLEAHPNEELIQILVKEATRALSQSVEYNQPIFMNGLLKACSNIACLRIERNGTKVKVRIDLDATAGYIYQWGEAVKAVRKNKNIGKAPAVIASKMFAEKYFGVDVLGTTIIRTRTSKKTGKTTSKDVTARYKGKYFATIQQRLEESGALAPWWMLLNYGSPSFKLSSDRGGYSELSTPQTLFVEHSQTIIQEIFDSELPKKLDEFTKQYRRNIKRNNEAILKLQVDILKLIAELEKLSPENIRVRIQKQLEALGQFEQADPAKLEKLAQDLAAGEKVTRRRLGGGVRPRLVRLMREYWNELSK